MREQSKDIYQFAAYYDVLFARDYSAECDFLEACLTRHGQKTCGERSFLELGCGPARNGRVLSQRGFRTVGLDLQPRMLDFAQLEAQREGVELELVEANLIDFDLTKPVAMAACMWDTLFLVLKNEDMVRHLRAVARNLLPGGIYVIETTHPRALLTPYDGHAYHGRVGDTDIEVVWGLPDDPYDAVAQQHLVTVRLTARRSSQDQIVDSYVEQLPQRLYQVQELRALIELSGAFSEVHYYGRSSLPLLPLSNDPECNGMIAVLVK